MLKRKVIANERLLTLASNRRNFDNELERNHECLSCSFIHLLNYLIMKKLAFAVVFILLSGFVSGQSLQKGNLIGTHVMTVNLKPGVTMDQFVEFFKSKVIPEMNKFEPDWKIYLVKGIRGDLKNSFGMIHVVKSEKIRDKYNNDDGSATELGKSVSDKLKPVFDELEKLGTFTTTYTDWVVQ
jgi:hypothetical protein